MYLAENDYLQYIYLFKKSKDEVKNKYMIEIKKIIEIKKGYDYKLNLYNFLFGKPDQDLCFSIVGINKEDIKKTFVIVCESQKDVEIWLENFSYLFRYLYNLTKNILFLHKIK